jgi:hypothetical protein
MPFRQPCNLEVQQGINIPRVVFIRKMQSSIEGKDVGDLGKLQQMLGDLLVVNKATRTFHNI